MAYVSKEMKAVAAPKIKALCAKYGVKGTLSIQNHSDLTLTVHSGKLDFVGSSIRKDWFNHDVNVYHIDKSFEEGPVRDFLNEVVDILKGDDYFDHSDCQIDYFHCSHYYSINIGRWNKPYVLAS